MRVHRSTEVYAQVTANYEEWEKQQQQRKMEQAEVSASTAALGVALDAAGIR